MHYFSNCSLLIKESNTLHRLQLNWCNNLVVENIAKKCNNMNQRNCDARVQHKVTANGETCTQHNSTEWIPYFVEARTTKFPISPILLFSEILKYLKARRTRRSSPFHLNQTFPLYNCVTQTYSKTIDDNIFHYLPTYIHQRLSFFNKWPNLDK